jgi:hypothetical protein
LTTAPMPSHGPLPCPGAQVSQTIVEAPEFV